MKCISWNCRGAKNSKSPIFPFLSNLSAKYSVDFIFLSETKSDVASLEKPFARMGFFDFTGWDAQSNSGGLFLAWSKRVVVNIIFVDANVILCNVTSELNDNYYVMFVYGCPYFDGRTAVWNTIAGLLHQHPGSIVLIGDINQVGETNHKLGGSKHIRGLDSFANWKMDCDITELPFHGVTYTWTNNRQGKKATFERLDRACANDPWRLQFPDASIWNLPILLSDHSPIILDTNPTSLRRKSPYKMEAWCLSNKEIEGIIINDWKDRFEGSHLFKIHRKLETIVGHTRRWCLDYKKHSGITWNKFEEELSTLQSKIGDESSIIQEAEQRKKLKIQLEQQWLYWKQRAKSKWDAYGDQSTSFFYKSVKTRGSANEIRAIKRGDESWTSESTEIKHEFHNFYTNLFSGTEDPTNVETDSWLQDLTTLSHSHKQLLSSPFTDLEIKGAAFASKPLKSPGPDGVPPIFFQKYWDVVGEEVCKGVHAFFDKGHMLKEANRTFIALIPKVQRPSTVGEFRPISLCNSLYKIISKCMVNRLKLVLPDIVGDTQNEFIPGRMMSDNCFIAHEIVNHVKKRKKGGRFEGILKVDLSKAYDRVRWDFLIKILRGMEFPDSWIHWIFQCISTVTYSVLVNGEQSQRITPKKGLRQGDPLSPYLFILLMEVLAKGVQRAESAGIVQGIKVARKAPPVSHLFFADDALFCFKATPSSCRAIRGIIDGFCAVSGEMINFGKSAVLFSPNTPSRFVRILRQPLGVSSTSVMGTYLGCPMDVDGRSSSRFNELLERINSKIGSWKFANLSAPGKLILINSVLIAMASHILSIYSCPKRVLAKISSSLTKFWWASSSSKRPIYWRKSELLFAHKTDGGLGLKNVAILNNALNSKAKLENAR